MLFIITLILTTFAIAGSAAFFSIYGLAQIFTGSFWPVVVMASSLEAGKLVSASFVYRYWHSISTVMKTYLISAILVLMLITSAGIFGFLSAAYQQDILPIKLNEQQITLLEQEKSELEKFKVERLERKKQIDNDIASLPNTYITSRQRLMKSYGEELDQLKIDIAQYTEQIRQKTLKIAELKNVNLEKEAHVGPIIFIANVFDKDVDDTTKWLILLIIFAFDPLAVMLTIGANMAILQRKKELSQLISDEEPSPSITSVTQLLKEPETEIDYMKISEMLEKMNSKEMTPEEIMQKKELEQLIRKKQIKASSLK